MMRLDTTTLRRTATVVRQRGNVDNLRHKNARGIDGTDSALTAIARTLDISLHLAKTQVESHLGAILCGIWAAYGVFFFEPRNPILPADDQEIT